MLVTLLELPLLPLRLLEWNIALNGFVLELVTAGFKMFECTGVGLSSWLM